MANKRDDFPASIKEILAKRVAYRCSNPLCKKVTVGPSSETTKAVSFGIAAHITAASVGGPRYNPNLLPAERADIDNGIWLCANCATLIDRDIIGHPVQLLKEWKAAGESEAKKGMYAPQVFAIKRPKLFNELLWNNSLSKNHGIIANSSNEIIQDMRFVKLYCSTEWDYQFTIVNNSSFPCFNIRIIQNGFRKFKFKDKLSNINNLAPLSEIKLRCSFENFYEMVADERRFSDPGENRFPRQLSEIEVVITYEDELGNIFQTNVAYNDGGANNQLVE